MNAPVLYLHIGTQKTGTTAIQEQLGAYRVELAHQGIAYPDQRPFMGGQSGKVHHELARAISRPHSSRPRGMEPFGKQLRGYSDQGVAVVISSEMFYTRVSRTHRDTATVKIEDYVSRRHEYFADAAAYFRHFQVRPILYLRRQDTFAESLFKERAKGLWRVPRTPLRTYRDSFARFLDDGAPLFDYDLQIALIREHFGDVTVVRYEDGNVLQRFLEIIGASLPGQSHSARANLSSDARIALWLQNCRVGTRLERNQFGTSQQAHALFSDYGRTTLWDSVDQRDEFLARYRSATYGGSYFPEPGPLGPPARLEPEDTERIWAAFLEWKASRVPLATSRGLTSNV